MSERDERHGNDQRWASKETKTHSAFVAMRDGRKDDGRLPLEASRAEQEGKVRRA